MAPKGMNFNSMKGMKSGDEVDEFLKRMKSGAEGDEFSKIFRRPVPQLEGDEKWRRRG